MKNKKIIGIIAVASLMGLSATFAKQTDTQTQAGSPSAQDQQSQSSQSSQDQSTQVQPASPSAIQDPAGASIATWDKEKFIKETAQNGVAEVNMAQLGATKSQDPGLKEVAQRLVTDHSKLNDQIKELASKKGITLSTDIDQKHQKMIDHLSGLSGAEFDKAFASHMVMGHKKSIAKFKQAVSSSNDDTEIREFASNTLPTLQEHLTLVQKYSPQTSAGTAVEEPAGAQKSDQEKQDSSKSSSDYKSPSDASQSPDQSATPKK